MRGLFPPRSSLDYHLEDILRYFSLKGCTLFVFLLAFLNIACVSFYLHWSENVGYSPSTPSTSTTGIRRDTIDVELEWFEILSKWSIDRLERFQVSKSTSIKYKVFFHPPPSSSYPSSSLDIREVLGVAKVMRPNYCLSSLISSFFSSTFRFFVNETTSIFKLEEGSAEDIWFFRRHDRHQFQGATELISFHVDQVLGLNLKVPTVHRVVLNTLFHQGTNLLSYFEFLLLRTLPSWNVDIVIQPWIHNLQEATPPSESLIPFLTHPSPLSPSFSSLPSSSLQHPSSPPSSHTPLSSILHISDLFVFGFLVDDHDRTVQKNWYSFSLSKGKDSQPVAWDSGLAFSHGPLGHKSCDQILCGLATWKDEALERGEDCERICLFSRQTILSLTNASQSLGNSVHKRLNSISPSLSRTLFSSMFFENISNDNSKDDRNHLYLFPETDFFKGLDLRVARLLSHVTECIQRFGEDAVLQ